MLQKGIFSHSEVTYSTGNIITFDYMSWHEAWFNYFHSNIRCYLFFLVFGQCFIHSISLSLSPRQNSGGRISHWTHVSQLTFFSKMCLASVALLSLTWEWQQCVRSRAAWTVGIQISAVGLWVPLFIIHWVFFLCSAFHNSVVVQMVLRKFALLCL